MMIDRKALKWAAKQKLRGQKPSPLMVTLAFLLLTAGISTIVRLVAMNPIQLTQAALSAADAGYSYTDILTALTSAQESRSTLFYPLNLLIMLYGWVVSFGYASYNLNRTRGLEAGYGSLISVFSRSGKVMLMNLIVMGFTFCWYLMVMMPVVIFTSIAVGVFSVVLMGSGGAGSEAFIWGILLLIFVVVVAALLALFFITARYAQTDYVLLDDPDVGALDAVRRSRAVMTGRTMEYVKLRLSFLGWELLTGLVAAVVFLGVWMLSLVIIHLTGGVVTDSSSITVGMVAAYGFALLASLPLTLWVTSYTHGTMAEYYCAITADSPAPLQPSGTWNASPGPDHSGGQGPDLF